MPKMSLSCTQCHKIIVSQYYEMDGAVYCVPCFEKKFSKECISCGKKIPPGEKYYTYEENKSIFCLKCSETPPCAACRFPVGKDPLNLKDGRKICKLCQPRVVFSDKMLEKILGAVKRCMSSLLKITVSGTIKIKLIDAIQLGRLCPGKNVKGYFSAVGSQETIYVLSGLLPGTTAAVLAHELTHAWQYENNIKNDLSPKDEEGFPEWVSYKVTSELNYFTSREAIKKNFYGKYREGFKMYLELEKKIGLQGVVQKIRGSW